MEGSTELLMPCICAGTSVTFFCRSRRALGDATLLLVTQRVCQTVHDQAAVQTRLLGADPAWQERQCSLMAALQLGGAQAALR